MVKRMSTGTATISYDGWSSRHDLEIAVDMGLLKPRPKPAAPTTTASRSKRKTNSTYRRGDPDTDQPDAKKAATAT